MPLADAALKRAFLSRLDAITTGSLRLITPEGASHDFGAGGPGAEVQIRDWAVVARIASRGGVGLGEAYVAGQWDTPSIEAVLQVAMLNQDKLAGFARGSVLQRLKFRVIDSILRANSRRGSSRNIRAHYDVGNEFYQLWLDRGMTYSSALFAPGDTDLGRAQDRKYDRILSRLNDSPRVLEIGCGWGGFAERAADQGREVAGLTISPSQKAYADARLDGRADIQLRDYRDSNGRFDNIVSIEMLEAVGQRYWPTYFGTLKARLAEGGRCVLQAITVPDARFDIYRRSSDYIRQHVFPGGMLPSHAEIVTNAEQAGLRLEGSFAFGRDYARTCRIWSERMDQERRRITALGYDATFLRGWHYYLQACAAAFEIGRTDVVQVELAHA